MAMLFARAVRSLPLILLLVLVAVIAYFVLAYKNSPNHAKEKLIRLFIRIGIALSVFFVLACLYALLEKNDLALDFMIGFLVVSLIELAITCICRAVFLKHHPNYRKKPVRTTKGPKEK